MDYKFLTIDEVIEIHQNQVGLYGGSSSIRDMNLLLSALEMPKSGIGEEYFHKDIFEMASAYLFHLVQNHPFIDGNKRVGLVSALVFLLNNDIELNFNNNELYDLVLSVAKGKSDKNKIAEFFRNNC
jgi:death-on-curing protein